MRKNILVTGGDGQLGSEIRVLSDKFDQYNFIFTDIGELDITDKGQIEKMMKSQVISCVINCAAYTAVDKAEDEMERARLINKTAVSNLAEVTSRHQSLN